MNPPQKPPENALFSQRKLPARFRFWLRERGFVVASISLDSPSISDAAVMQRAIADDQTILTFDRDYGELVFVHGFRPSGGVIYFRFDDFDSEEPAKILFEVLNDPDFEFHGLFTALTREKIK